MPVYKRMLVLMIFLPLAAHAQMFKCKRADGSTAYQDVECPPGASSTKLADISSSSRPMLLTPDGHGQFHAHLSINGVNVDGIIDTGASMVVISNSTARMMGITPEGASFGNIQTANGMTSASMKVIPVVRVGNFDLYNVEVIMTENTPTLIGMSALGRLKMNQENGQLNLSKR
jgi:aspartyl protease family protein